MRPGVTVAADRSIERASLGMRLASGKHGLDSLPADQDRLVSPDLAGFHIDQPPRSNRGALTRHLAPPSSCAGHGSRSRDPPGEPAVTSAARMPAISDTRPDDAEGPPSRAPR